MINLNLILNEKFLKIFFLISNLVLLVDFNLIFLKFFLDIEIIQQETLQNKSPIKTPNDKFNYFTTNVLTETEIKIINSLDFLESEKKIN